MLVYPTGIPTGGSGYTIENSIWLDGSADELTFTPSQDGTGVGKKYTLSFWTKTVDTDDEGSFFCAGQSGGDSLHIQTNWNSGNEWLNVNDSSGGSSNWLRRTGHRRFRDPTAWVHFILAVDNSSGGGLAGTANAARVYINGVEDTSFPEANSHPPSSDTSRMTMQYEHVIGNGSGFSDFKDMYIAEFIIVDGQQLAATDLGEFDDNGVWVPINPSGLTFGNNGCHLDFALAQGTGNGPGNDVSGKDNHWANPSSNIAAGQTTTDSPTDDASSDIGNYATINPLHQSDATLSGGNLTMVGQGAVSPYSSALTTMTLFDYAYFEVNMVARSAPSSNGDRTAAIFAATTTPIGDVDVNLNSNSNISGVDNGFIPRTGGSSGTDPSLSWEVGQFGAFAIRADGSGGTNIFVAEGGASNWIYGSGTTGNPTGNANPTLNISGVPPHELLAGGQCYLSTDSLSFNFGQTSFQYTPPTGFKGVNTANLPAPTVTDPSAYFQVKTYTGNGGTQAITFDGNSDLAPDFVWVKCRDVGYHHQLFDTVRGTANPNNISADLADAQMTGELTAFGSDGFTLVHNGSVGRANTNTDDYVAWCWKAGGAPTADNDNTSGAMDDGSVFKSGVEQSSYTPSGSPSTYPKKMSIASHGGFSIVEFVGTGANATVPHGLDSNPGFFMIKCTSHAKNWGGWHEVIGAQDKFLSLMTLNAVSGDQGGVTWQNNPVASSHVITLGSQDGQNGSSETHIMYSWAKVPGLIGIGSYTGNSATDGSYVVVDDGASGFRPAWVMIKRTDGADEWVIFDSMRNPYNNAEKYLSASYADGDRTNGAAKVDLFSNGFRPTVNHARVNTGTYLYLAFAENPFGGEDVAQARAR